ncbi:MAG: Mth938-like domain-containing protein [Rhodocyclaceae bacterium]|nr:Mth938-like domain-containing protein [Rhodocyclaceae bacterium]
MKLHADLRAGNAIAAHGEGYVVVGERRYERSLIVTPERVIGDWGPADAAGLTAAHLDALLETGCDVLLLGTGRRQVFPPVPLLRGLVERGRSLEPMDTGAACRTFNILLAEGRSVAVGLIV